MDQVELVLATSERVTLRVGDVFLKIDVDQTRTDVEVEAMALAPVPTPEILWRKPPVLAVAAVPGRALGRLEAPSTESPAAWAATGAATRALLVRGVPGRRAVRPRHSHARTPRVPGGCLRRLRHQGRPRPDSRWWSWRCLVVVRWLAENGYGSPDEYAEIGVLRSQS